MGGDFFWRVAGRIIALEQACGYRLASCPDLLVLALHEITRALARVSICSCGCLDLLRVRPAKVEGDAIPESHESVVMCVEGHSSECRPHTL